MPPIRSPKGNTPNDNNKGKGKAPPPRGTRKPPKDSKVDPCQCEICGYVVSRKCDLPRHLKTHASEDEKQRMKLPCTWEGCPYSTLQQSNLDVHYRTHTKEKDQICYDDPECEFESSHPSSLTRHRKSDHGYVPGSEPKKRKKRKKQQQQQHVPVLRVEADSARASVALHIFPSESSAEASTVTSGSQPFSESTVASASGTQPFFAETLTSGLSSSRRFSSVISTSGSSSRRLYEQATTSLVLSSSQLLPPASFAPSPPLPFPLSPLPSSSLSQAPATSSTSSSQPPQQQQQSCLRIYPPTYFSGESEVSAMTPGTSITSNQESSAVLDYVDPSHGYHQSRYTTANVLDCSSALRGWECLQVNQYPVEAVYDTAMSMEQVAVLSPPFSEKEEWWPRGDIMAGQLFGSEGHAALPVVEQQHHHHQQYQQQPPSSSSPFNLHAQFEQPIHINPYHPIHNPPFDGGYDYHHGHGLYQQNTQHRDLHYYYCAQRV